MKTKGSKKLHMALCACDELDLPDEPERAAG